MMKNKLNSRVLFFVLFASISVIHFASAFTPAKAQSTSYVVSLTSHFDHPKLKSMLAWIHTERPLNDFLPDFTFKVDAIRFGKTAPAISYITQKRTWTGLHLSYHFEHDFSQSSPSELFQVIQSFEQSQRTKITSTGSTIHFKWNDFEIKYVISHIDPDNRASELKILIRKIAYAKGA